MSDTTSLSPTERIRRFLLLVALAFSFGGFSFYAAVVVPVGSAVLDSTSQGFVTRQVTHFLNAGQFVLLLILAWEIRAGNQTKAARRQLLILCGILSLCCTGLIIAHPWLDSLLDAEAFSISHPEEFYFRHRVYLWVSSVQWLATLTLIWVLQASWQSPPATGAVPASESDSARSESDNARSL